MTREEAMTMTKEQIIETLEDMHNTPFGDDLWFAYNEYYVALEVAIKALEKQVPRKPIPFICDSGDTPHQAYRCPVCGEEVLEGDGCSNNICRQAIDWSGNND